VTMGSGVQRKIMRKELSDAQKKTWEQQNGDQICSKIKTALDQWKAFRGNPASYQSLKDIKSHGACSQLSELVRLGGADFGQFAKEKLGADAPPYLSEMAAFIGDFALLINVVPGVAHQDPKHEYTMKKDETSSWNNVPFVPFTSLTVEYRNAFGWYWKRDFTGTQLQWKVGVEFKPMEAPGKKLGGGGVAGDPAKNKVNPMIPLPATISINVDCKAKPSGYGYWGFDNLAGALTTADGPSLKGTYLGFGAKTATGGIISIIGSGGPVGTLDFLNIQTKFALKPDGPDNPLESGKPDETGKWKKKGATISATLVAAGAGGMKATGPAQVSVPELRPKPVLEEQQWKYFIYGFETGSADAPIPIPEVNPIALMAKSDVDKKKAELDSIQEYLKEAGIKESFKVSVMCEGYASRRWEAAGNNESVRKQKNQELSERRAQNVLEDFRGVLGVEHDYSAVGKGPAVAQVTMQDAQTKTSMVTEEGKDIVDQKLREIAKTYESAGATPDEAKRKAELERKNVEQSIGRDSNQREARRVNVLVVWRGHKIEWAPGHQPNPSVPASGGGK
ncbi:MAG TPA: hypothetical protein VIU61_08775, partial [Kofleriaceae bacterium]